MGYHEPASPAFVSGSSLPQSRCMYQSSLTMMLTSTSQSLWLLVAGVAVLALARRLFGELRSPLRKVPGPTAARFSRWWYLKNVAKGNFHKVNIDLHRQYGEFSIQVLNNI